MPSMRAELPPSFQAYFHRRWGHLHDPHVRALAWLLDAPGLLDADAACWEGRIAVLDQVSHETAGWLQQLDAAPAALHAMLDTQPSHRLGRYAEKLMTFYLQHSGRLIAHNVQVRAGPNATIGEFDFLVRDGAAAIHWEFATKFYLLQTSPRDVGAEAFVGPNLADSLGAKMRKIMQQQLILAQHPAAQQYLSVVVSKAQALVKGWLFYPESEAVLPARLGIAPDHCRGFWSSLSGFDLNRATHYVLLPRLSWLAPARCTLDQALSGTQLVAMLAQDFSITPAPVLIALCERDGDILLERERGFIVPDKWSAQATQKLQHAIVSV